MDNNNLPYWGRVTSTLDWCEENYNVHEYIAEFINTTTNFIFIFLAIYGFYNTWKLGFEKRFLLAYAAISFIGMGSFFFHMTLLYEFQLLDELPMIYGTCILLYNIFETEHKRKYGIYLPLSLLTYALSITIAYLYNQNPVFHQVSYGIMISILNFRSYYMLSLVKKNETQVVLKQLLFGSWIIFSLGFLVWNIDNIACHQLRTIRRNLKWSVVGHLFELHGWWHIGTAIGSYYWIVFNQYIRLVSLNKDGNYEINWELGFLPRIGEVEKRRTESLATRKKV